MEVALLYGNFVTVGLPAYRLRLLRLVLSYRSSDAPSPAVWPRHRRSCRLRAPKRIENKPSVTINSSLQRHPPPHPTRCWLSQSASTTVVFEVPAHRLIIVGHQSFPVVAASLCVCRTLPCEAVTRSLRLLCLSSTFPLSAENIRIMTLISGTYCLIVLHCAETTGIAIRTALLYSRWITYLLCLYWYSWNSQLRSR